MGKAIVYCRACGTGLREADFTAGRAHRAGASTYCSRCVETAPTAPSPSETPRAGTRMGSTAHVPLVHPTSRRHVAEGAGQASRAGRMALFGGIGAVAVLLLLVLAASGGGRPPSVRPSVPPPPSEPPAVAKTSPSRDPVPPRADKPPPPTAPDAARVEEQMRKELEGQKAAQFDRNLADLGALIERTEPGAKTEEIDRLLDSLAMVAKDRHPQVARLRALHEEKLAGAKPADPTPSAPPPPAPERSASVPDGLEGHWTLDAILDGRSEDRSGLGRHAVVKGTLETVPGRIGKGIRFTGDDSHLELPRVPALDTLQEGSYSLAAWFRPDEVPRGPEDDNRAFSAVVIKSGMHLGLSYSYDHGGAFEMMQWFSGMTRAGEVAKQSSPAKEWHHLAGVVDRKEEQTLLYVDGRVLSRTPWPKGSRSAEANYRRKPWTLGVALPKAEKWGWSARGVIDDVRIYSRVLSSAEVSALHAGTGGPAGAPVRTLFDGTDLSNWETPKGDWRIADGALAADLRDPSPRSIHTRESFRNYELTAQIRVEARTYVEIHLHSYAVNYGGHLDAGGWTPLKIVVREGEEAVTLERASLQRNGRPPGAGSGWIGFFANGALRIKDVRLRVLE